MRDSSFHIVYVIDPGGGPEALIKNLAPYLAKQGIRISVILSNPPKDRIAFPQGIQVYPFQWRNKQVKNAHRIGKKLKSLEPVSYRFKCENVRNS